MPVVHVKSGSLGKKSGSVRKLTGTLKSLFRLGKKSSRAGETTARLAQFSPRARSASTIQSLAQASPVVCSITSLTVANVPSTRARTKVGVGEAVTLTFSDGSASWTTTAWSLSATTGSSVTWTAPQDAASVTITAKGDKWTATIAFSVMKPSGVRIIQEPLTGVWHVHNTGSVGFKGIA